MINDYMIQEIAISICENLGLDPHKEVATSFYKISTPQEREEQGHTDFCMTLLVPMWKTYRATAAEHIAAHLAFRKLDIATLE